MKVFVYTKKESKLILTLEHIISVQKLAGNTLLVANEAGEAVTVDTKQYKTTIYQN